MDDSQRLKQFEEQFHRQLRTRAEVLARSPLPADRVRFESLPDGADAARDTLARLERFDRSLIDRLPGTRTVQMRFQREWLGGLFLSEVKRLRGQVLVPFEALIRGEPAEPVTREQLLDALARYELMPRNQRPELVVFASGTGFTADAMTLVEADVPVQLMLLGAREDGGWDLAAPQVLQRSPWLKLVEFETLDDRLQRLRYHLDEHALQLESRGVPLAELAEHLGMPAAQTEALVRRACRADSRLLIVVHDGQMRVSRSPLAEESSTMSLWSRIRRLLRLKPSTAERVRELTKQRVTLEQQRHEIDTRLNTLEAEERTALEQGAAARSDAEKKQIASRLMRVRRDLRRLRSQGTVFTQQIDILGTHIHNLTLAEQGRRTALPKAEELTREAAEAEQVVGELAANAELAGSIEVGAPTPAMEEEEAAILAEFDQVARESAQESAPAEAQQSAESARAQETAAASRREAERSGEARPAAPPREKAGPEMG